MSGKAKLVDDTANLVMEVVPLVMRSIRHELRRSRNFELSVPQFRILAFVQRVRSASLSDIADNLGLALPSMSKMVDGLVRRALLVRSEDQHDRRRIAIRLSEEGQAVWEKAHERARCAISERLSRLDEEAHVGIARALKALEELFASNSDAAARP